MFVRHAICYIVAWLMGWYAGGAYGYWSLIVTLPTIYLFATWIMTTRLLDFLKGDK